MAAKPKYLTEDYVRKNEVQWYREKILLGLDRNAEYLLCNDVGRKLSTSAFITLPDTWAHIAQRAKEYSTDYSAMAWFVQFTMSPNTQTISASVLAGFPDYAAALLRETLEGEELSFALDVNPKYSKETTGKKLRFLEDSYSDFALRKELLSNALEIAGENLANQLRKFYSIISEYSHAQGRILRAFRSGGLSDHFPAMSEDFDKGKDLVKDYLPESWIFSKVELEQVEEEMESVSRLDDIILTFCNLADDLFGLWLRHFKK